jgi:DNA-binding GntR family transcriptional regulator
MTEPPPPPARSSGRFDLPALTPLPTAAERAADLIRDHIFNGQFAPGVPLPETVLAQALQVSRNTVRDAFRTLMHERLLSYEQYRGVSVRSLSEDDVRDIYELRRLIELSSIDMIERAAGVVSYAGMRQVVAESQRLQQAGQWAEVGTVDLRFHTELVALRGSVRTNQFFRQLLTELRLGFLAVSDAKALHQPYAPRNVMILERLEAGDFGAARIELEKYLKDAEEQIVAAVVAHETDRSR